MRKDRKRQKYKACMIQWQYLFELIKKHKLYYNCDLYVSKGDISKSFYEYQVSTCYTKWAAFPIKAFIRADGLMRIGDGKIKLWFTYPNKL